MKFTFHKKMHLSTFLQNKTAIQQRSQANQASKEQANFAISSAIQTVKFFGYYSNQTAKLQNLIEPRASNAELMEAAGDKWAEGCVTYGGPPKNVHNNNLAG